MGGARVFRGRRAALLTKHGKERVIAPVLEKATGCRVVVQSSYDTDLYGTFTMEIARPGSQLETARLKARKAMELVDTDLGVASEGSFGPHPGNPFIPWNRELVLLIDEASRLEVCGEYAGPETNYGQLAARDWEEAEAFAGKAGFPGHFLIVSPHTEKAAFVKGISSWEQLREAFLWGTARSADGCALVQTDMRAHANPTRMANIKKATEDLARKIAQKCPQCRAMGFAVVSYQRGLPCAWCGLPTNEIKAQVSTCQKCGFTRETPAGTQLADPGRCGFCNP